MLYDLQQRFFFPIQHKQHAPIPIVVLVLIKLSGDSFFCFCSDSEQATRTDSYCCVGRHVVYYSAVGQLAGLLH